MSGDHTARVSKSSVVQVGTITAYYSAKVRVQYNYRFSLTHKFVNFLTTTPVNFHFQFIGPTATQARHII